MRRARSVIGILLILFGILIYLIPNFKEYSLNHDMDMVVKEFKTAIDKKKAESEEGSSGSEQKDIEDLPADENGDIVNMSSGFLSSLRKEMENYNEHLAKDGQHLTDAWSYRQSPVNLGELKELKGAVGYIKIPDMNVQLPLYIGASETNMALGAAVMGETSMPVGGINTNSVIVGHRGYSGAPYFKEIELLKEGSLVYVTNPWETLIYKVRNIKIIQPYDVNSILIEPGKDMITLLTCHPYMSHGKYRYCFCCERGREDEINAEEGEDKAVRIPSGDDTEIVNMVPEEFASSENFIVIERNLRRVIPLILLAILLIMIISNLSESLKKKRKHRSGKD